jgi:hypothetical protein
LTFFFFGFVSELSLVSLSASLSAFLLAFISFFSLLLGPEKPLGPGEVPDEEGAGVLLSSSEGVPEEGCRVPVFND